MSASSASSALFRALPSTDRCLDALARLSDMLPPDPQPDNVQQDDQPLTDLQNDLARAPRVLVKEGIAAYWANIRQDIRQGRIQDPAALSLERHVRPLALFVQRFVEPALKQVINATGVVIHTNTGRSVLPAPACEALLAAASGNTNVELDLATGTRGHRDNILKSLVCRLTGAEDALMVNNNAAAVLLALDTFCKGQEVLISRSELVEIGGSFRIPDVMEATGVRLREVGATNRAHERDYVAAIGEQTRAIVRVHQSNFRIIGFTSEVPTRELAKIAHEHSLLLINDLGSGSLTDFAAHNLPGEPTVQECLADGSDLVLFSGDKLLGGPQAGIIAGRADLVARLRKNPLLRALRCSKLIYAAMEATLRLYLDKESAATQIPTVQRMIMRRDDLLPRAQHLAELVREQAGALANVRLLEGSSRCGGGAFPEVPLPTVLVGIEPAHGSVEGLRTRLLQSRPALIGRLEQDAFCLDPRSLAEEDLPLVASLVGRALQHLQTAQG